jgi:hypothetical protein
MLACDLNPDDNRKLYGILSTTNEDKPEEHVMSGEFRSQDLFHGRFVSIPPGYRLFGHTETKQFHTM